MFPFILDGVSMLGMNGVRVPSDERRARRRRLATDPRPCGLGGSLTEARERWIVRVGG